VRAEWREMQAAGLEMVERGTYAHKVLRYKYQDVADMRMARQGDAPAVRGLPGEEPVTRVDVVHHRSFKAACPV